jgi:cell division protein FtsL
MTRITLLLMALLLGSCLVLVHNAYESRRLYAALDRARAEQHLLDAEFRRLDAERQAQATPLRVERMARERLLMSTQPLATRYVTDTGVPTPPTQIAASAPDR